LKEKAKEHAPETRETKGSISMWTHYKKTAMKPLGLLLDIGVLVASAGYGQEPRDVNPSLRLAAAVPGLTEALRDENPSVREAAAMALREMMPEAKAAMPALAELLRDRDVYLRSTASHTLERMGADAVPSLVPLLRDPDFRVRELAATSLRQIRSDMGMGVPANAR
jgi:HEAT repeat protein